MKRFLKLCFLSIAFIIICTGICFLLIMSGKTYHNNCEFNNINRESNNYQYTVGDSNYWVALKIIKEFENQKNDTLAFSKIPKKILIKQLKWRLSNPETLSQGRGGRYLCGPAAVAWCYLSYNPQGYVSTIIELYKNGFANCNDETIYTNKTSCSTGMKNSQYVSDKLDSRLFAIDYIFLSALRYTENDGFSSLLSYNVDTNTPFINGTWPHEINDLLSLVNLRTTCGSFYRHTGFTAKKSSFTSEDLEKIFDALNHKYLVILLIDYNHFNKLYPSWFGSNFGNHFIVAHGLIQYNKKQFALKYWEFANSKKQTGKYTLEDFNTNIKGYWIIAHQSNQR